MTLQFFSLSLSLSLSPSLSPMFLTFLLDILGSGTRAVAWELLFFDGF